MASPVVDARGAGCALYYVPDGFETRGRKRLMGRHAAGESFLRGLALHLTAPQMGAAVPGPEAADHLRARFRDWTARPAIDAFRHDDLAGLSRHGVLMRPDPHIAREAWPRQRASRLAYALCGVTHTISSEGALDAIADLASAPLEPHDALICTSRAVRVAVDAMLERVCSQLADRYGGRPPELPMRPVIPLGIHADDFTVLADVRQAWRASMGVAQEDILLLWFGRLSFHAKAHPHSLFRAAQRATERLGRRVHIALAGWFADGHQERVFRAGAERLCPDVTLHVFDGRDERVRREAWSAGDAFVLPVDNIQETFGLAPLEAMAAGLVPIVPAWNGFRDTVTDGETGLLVPCAMPPPGSGSELMAAHESGRLDYDRYLAASAQSVWVDEVAMADAIVRLVSDESFRRRLSEAGKHHARASFDWSVIIPRYQELWAEQNDRLIAARRGAATEPASIGWENPRRPDPFAMFAHYPDKRIGPQTLVRAVDRLDMSTIREIAQAPGALSIPGVLLGMADLMDLVSPLSERPVSWAELISKVNKDRQDAAMRSLFWLAKNGLVRFELLDNQDASGRPIEALERNTSDRP